MQMQSLPKCTINYYLNVTMTWLGFLYAKLLEELVVEYIWTYSQWVLQGSLINESFLVIFKKHPLRLYHKRREAQEIGGKNEDHHNMMQEWFKHDKSKCTTNYAMALTMWLSIWNINKVKNRRRKPTPGFLTIRLSGTECGLTGC